jgi:hypothetical protein
MKCPKNFQTTEFLTPKGLASGAPIPFDLDR